MATDNPFVKLSAVDFKDHLEVKKSGNTELKYVSWAYAWAEVKKLYPDASYEVKKFNGLPYVYDPITGFMVYTSVTIEGVSHEMWLPVLDSSNKAMKAVPYTYTTPKWDYNPQTRRREKIGMEERTVDAASMFDVNKAIMRCLVKNLAMFGLGLYVYDVRHDDDCRGIPCEIAPFIMVNHWGTIILAEPLELPDDGRRYIDEETDWNYDPFGGAEKNQKPCVTVGEFMNQYLNR